MKTLGKGEARISNSVEAVIDSGNGSGHSEAIVSSCGAGQGRGLEALRPWRLQCRDCEELLHELSNLITGVLTSAKLLAWKLPPYSHLKRSVRELERNALRGSELLNRLTRRLATDHHEADEADVPDPARR